MWDADSVALSRIIWEPPSGSTFCLFTRLSASAARAASVGPRTTRASDLSPSGTSTNLDSERKANNTHCHCYHRSIGCLLPLSVVKEINGPRRQRTQPLNIAHCLEPVYISSRLSEGWRCKLSDSDGHLGLNDLQSTSSQEPSSQHDDRYTHRHAARCRGGKLRDSNDSRNQAEDR